ncbi:MAG: glycosyltransferase [Thermodesulfobacteriota bacterium]
MRTIQVANVRWFNATAWYALYLARLLNDAGHETLCLTLPGTEAEAKAQDWGLPVRSLDLNAKSPLAQLALFPALGRLVREFAPDVVNCHRGEAFLHFGLLRRRLGSFALVRTRGDQRPPKANPVNRWLHARAADAVVATNSRMQRHFLERFGLPADRVRLIPGGVDAARFAFDPAGRERVRAEFGYGPEHFVVGLLGRFDAVKGQRDLIRACARLVHGHGMSRLRLLLIGFPTATSQAEVAGWIAEEDMAEHAAITGERPDVAACVSALDLGAVASLWSETIARAALEIMACGVPLVSTDVGVMPDLLAAEALAPAGDGEALAALLGRASTDAAWRDSLRQGQARTVAGLRGEDFLAATLGLYRELRP